MLVVFCVFVALSCGPLVFVHQAFFWFWEVLHSIWFQSGLFDATHICFRCVDIVAKCWPITFMSDSRLILGFVLGVVLWTTLFFINFLLGSPRVSKRRLKTAEVVYGFGSSCVVLGRELEMIRVARPYSTAHCDTHEV